MTVGFVQVKEAGTAAANPSITLDAPPTEGNLVLVFLRHSNGNIVTHPTGGYGALFAIHDSSSFTTGDLYSSSDVIGVYGKIAGEDESATVTFQQSQGQTSLLIAYELTGTWDPEIPMVEGWVSNGGVAVTSRAFANLSVAGDGGAVFGVCETRLNTSATIAHTMTTDRVDTHNSSGATLTVGCVFDADADTYSDTVSWTGAQNALGFIISIVDQGRDTVATEDITGEIPNIVIDCGDAATALAGIDDPLAARLVAGQATLNTATTTLSGLLLDKAGWVEDYAGVNAQVFLAPEDEGSSGPDLTHMIGPAMETLDDGWTLRFPTNRYRCELANIRPTFRNGVTYEGPPYALAPDILAGDGPPAVTPTFYRTSHEYHPSARHFEFEDCAGIAVSRLRVEGDNTLSDTPDVPVLEDSYGSYDKNWEAQHAFDFTRCNGVTLAYLYAYAVWGDGLGVLQTTNLVLDGIDVRYNGRQAVSISIGSDIVMNDLYLPNSRRSSIDLEPHNVSDNDILRVTIDGVISDPTLSHVASIGTGLVNDISISNLTAKHARTNLVYVSAGDQTRRANWTIDGFVMEEEWSSPLNGRPCVRFNWVDSATVTNSVIPVAADSGIKSTIRFHECGGDLVVTGVDADPGGEEPLLVDCTSPLTHSGNSWN
jgi:hypothetical protein